MQMVFVSGGVGISLRIIKVLARSSCPKSPRIQRVIKGARVEFFPCPIMQSPQIALRMADADQRDGGVLVSSEARKPNILGGADKYSTLAHPFASARYPPPADYPPIGPWSKISHGHVRHCSFHPK